jgi:hypothetical protein
MTNQSVIVKNVTKKNVKILIPIKIREVAQKKRKIDVHIKKKVVVAA